MLLTALNREWNGKKHGPYECAHQGTVLLQQVSALCVNMPYTRVDPRRLPISSNHVSQHNQNLLYSDSWDTIVLYCTGMVVHHTATGVGLLCSYSYN